MRDGTKLQIETHHRPNPTAQGADPKIIRLRKPAIVTAAEEALATGIPLLAPAIASRHSRQSYSQLDHP